MAAAWISASLLLCLLDFDFAFSEGQIIKAVIGENPILQCKAENRPILFVEWKRTDIKEGNVLRYRNDAVDRDNQHQSFKERVVFQDIEIKDGDVSLVLINVRMNDNGTYEAEVVYDGTDSVKKLICSIHLHVTPPPPSPPPPPSASVLPSAIALLVIPAVLVVILIGFIFYHRRRSKSVAERIRRSEELRSSYEERCRRLEELNHSLQGVKEEKKTKKIDEYLSSKELTRRLPSYHEERPGIMEESPPSYQVPQVEVEEGEESVLQP